jgi:hypothetical protein
VADFSDTLPYLEPRFTGAPLVSILRTILSASPKLLAAATLAVLAGAMSIGQAQAGTLHRPRVVHHVRRAPRHIVHRVAIVHPRRHIVHRAG